MNKIALKTAKRRTSVTRVAVKEAVDGVFTKKAPPGNVVADDDSKGAAGKTRKN